MSDAWSFLLKLQLYLVARYATQSTRGLSTALQRTKPKYSEFSPSLPKGYLLCVELVYVLFTVCNAEYRGLSTSLQRNKTQIFRNSLLAKGIFIVRGVCVSAIYGMQHRLKHSPSKKQNPNIQNSLSLPKAYLSCVVPPAVHHLCLAKIISNKQGGEESVSAPFWKTNSDEY